jgi:hypothetical protein
MISSVREWRGKKILPRKKDRSKTNKEALGNGVE